MMDLNDIVTALIRIVRSDGPMSKALIKSCLDLDLGSARTIRARNGGNFTVLRAQTADKWTTVTVDVQNHPVMKISFIFDGLGPKITEFKKDALTNKRVWDSRLSDGYNIAGNIEDVEVELGVSVLTDEVGIISAHRA